MPPWAAILISVTLILMFGEVDHCIVLALLRSKRSYMLNARVYDSTFMQLFIL